jgi:hypothetical protein
MRELLDERQWRVYLGTEARALGHGGIAAVARTSGVSPATATATAAAGAGAAGAGDEGELAVLARGRPRRPGAGRPKAGYDLNQCWRREVAKRAGGGGGISGWTAGSAADRGISGGRRDQRRTAGLVVDGG